MHQGEDNTPRPSGARRTLGAWRAPAFAAVIAAAMAPAAPAADVLVGLDERPPNPTCVAPERAVVSTGWRIEQAFPALSFETVPHQSHAQFRNGVIDLAQIPGDNAHWYVVERAGKVHRVANDDSATSFTTVLDISDAFTSQYFEQWGINSIAFHPDFASNGELYVLYNDRSGSTWYAVLARFTSIDGGLSFDAATEEVLLSVPDDQIYHQFGDLHFGPDGYLYASLGAPTRADGQNLDDLHGSLLRLDVDAPFPYGIPADNPFASGGGRPEIFAFGLRNPWRFSFDRQTGEIWLGDVGESLAEEINRIESGANYGWNIAQGNYCSPGDCPGVTWPAYTYPHSDGKAVTGGYVYRGAAIPELSGRYVFGDSYSGEKIWALTYDGNGDITGKETLIDPIRVTGFAEDQLGELLAIDLFDSAVYRLLPGGNGGATPDFPQALSATGCFDPDNPTQPVAGLIPYDVNAPLWSDWADKRRWMALPDGATVSLTDDGDFEFPPGTVLVKEFSFHGTPVETRLLMRHPDGVWAGYSYEWAGDLSDAALLSDAKTTTVDGNLTWQFPSPSQCMQCHLEGSGYALGPETAQLNGRFTYPATGHSANQLNTLAGIEALRGGLPGTISDEPALVPPLDVTRPITTRARSYLHANCAGCHRPGGTSQSSLDLRYSTPVQDMNACNVTPQHGDQGVSGAKLVFPGSASQSVLSLRMHAQGGSRMPPLGTLIVDPIGTAVVDAWLALPTVCDPVADSDGDGTTDDLDNCLAAPNASQTDADGDGYGNVCDADLSNDCIVNTVDLGLLKTQFFAAGIANADLNADGIVNALDLGILKTAFFTAPGPSALSATCSD